MERIGLAQWHREIRRRLTKMCESGAQLPYPNRLLWQDSLTAILNADTLHFASTAIITGEITAQSVTIDGRVLGSIVADKVFLSATAHFEGQLHCQDVAVDDGAHVNAKFTKEPVTNG